MKLLLHLPLFLFITVFPFGSNILAQIVPELEISGTFLTTNNANFKGKGGVGAGINVSFFDDKRFNLVVGVNFAVNSFWTNQAGGGKYEPTTEGKGTASSIFLPILLRYNTSGTTKFIAELGPALEGALNYHKSYFIAGHGAVGVRFPVGKDEMIAKAFYHYTPGVVSTDEMNRFQFNASYIGLSVGYRIKR